MLKPYLILDKLINDGSGEQHPIKIGCIGFVPPQIMIWDSANLEGKVAVRDIVKTAEAYVPVMKEQGADLIIALAKDFPNFGYVKEESQPVIPRMKAELSARP